MSTYLNAIDGFLHFSPLFPIAFYLMYEGFRASQEREMLQGASDEEAATLPRDIERNRWRRIKGFIAFEVIFTLLVLFLRIAIRG